MRQRLFNLAAVVSLVLCVVTSVACACSYWFAADCGYLRVVTDPGTAIRGELRVYGACVRQGRIQFHRDVRPFQDAYVTTRILHVDAAGLSRLRAAAGFRCGTHDFQGHHGSGTFASLPIAPLIVAWGGLPLVWLRRAVRERRRPREGTCPICGYDLTGNASGRCPECGTAATSSAPG